MINQGASAPFYLDTTMASLHFHYASMNSGKSTHLLQVAHNYKERGMNVLLLKPAIDTRDGNKISSRIGIEQECILFNKTDDMRDFIKEVDCVLVDEAQFLTDKQVGQLAYIVDFMHIPVMCYGLSTDFRGYLFEGSKALFELANKKVEHSTICHCGKKAHMVLRVVDGMVVKYGDQIQIGGNESYISVCRKHFTLNEFE